MWHHTLQKAENIINGVSAMASLRGRSVQRWYWLESGQMDFQPFRLYQRAFTLALTIVRVQIRRQRCTLPWDKSSNRWRFFVTKNYCSRIIHDRNLPTGTVHPHLPPNIEEARVTNVLDFGALNDMTEFWCPKCWLLERQLKTKTT